MRRVLLLIVMSFVMTSLLFASEVVLTSGRKVEGKIVEQTAKYIKIIDSSLDVAITYYNDEIATVDGQRLGDARSSASSIEGEGSASNGTGNSFKEAPSQANKAILAETKSEFSKASANLESDAPSQVQGQIDEVLSKYRALKNFSARYQYYRLEDYQTASPDNPKDLKQGWTKIEGPITFAAPDRIRFEYEQTTESQPSAPGLYISDGSQYWSYRRNQRSQLNYVTKGSIKGQEDMAGIMMKGMADMQGFYSKMAGNQDSAEGGFSRPVSFVLMVPIMPGFQDLGDMLSLKPFKGIDAKQVTYIGEEDVNGAKTWKFEVRESERQNQSIHWIGLDGVVRKIEEYSKYNNRLQTKIELDDVKTDNILDDKVFTYDPVAGIQVMDMDKGMQEFQGKIKESAHVPPEKIFQGYFENPLEDITGLQGSGFAMFGHDVFIRFQSNKEIVPKNKQEYKVVTVEDQGEPVFPRKATAKEMAALFVKVFPQDAESLGSPDTFTAMEVSKHEYRWFLFDKFKGLYFFRSRAGFVD